MGVLIAGAAAIWIFAWHISAHQAQHTLIGYGNAESYADATHARITRACAGHAEPAVLECVAEQIEASREDQRAEYDLSAQNRMADWALLTMVWGFATTIISGLALWFLKGTLDATRKAVDEAGDATKAARDAVAVTRQSAEKQLRAWVTVLRIYVDTLEAGKPLLAHVTLRNHGQTTAKSIQVRGASARCVAPIMADSVRVRLHRAVPMHDLGGGQETTQQLTLQEAPLTDETIASIKANQFTYVLALYVSYKDVFGKTRRVIIRSVFDDLSVASIRQNGHMPLGVCAKNNRTS